MSMMQDQKVYETIRILETAGSTAFTLALHDLNVLIRYVNFVPSRFGGFEIDLTFFCIVFAVAGMSILCSSSALPIVQHLPLRHSEIL